ncbi:MAG: substrate binding domain-containing protein, partial [Giesbergeria sp.]|nr:substrate binding domain-containing protein [Giesbergeria sp.]
LVEQGADLALRIGRLADSALGARYLGSNPWVMVAAPAYLQSHPAPRVPADLAQHPCLVYSSVQGDDRWSLTGPSGEEASVPVTGPLRTNNLSTVLAAVHDGMGVAVLPLYLAREALDEGTAVQVMKDYALPAQEVHAVFPSPKLVPSKVTHFIGFLQQALAGEWWAKPQRRAQGGG